MSFESELAALVDSYRNVLHKTHIAKALVDVAEIAEKDETWVYDEVNQPLSTAPAWVPEGARAHLDFINEQYWSGGAEVGDLSTLIENPVVDAGGLELTQSQMDMLGSLFEDMKFPCTFFVHAFDPLASSRSTILEFLDASGLKYGGFSFYYAWMTSDDYDTYIQTDNLTVSDGEAKAAARLSQSNVGLAANGAAAALDSSSASSVDFVASEIATMTIKWGDPAYRIKMITVYEALLSDAELQALTT